MSIQQQFADAQEKVKTLTQRPSNEELLDLYALFKQATDGDNNTSKPGMFDMKGQFKWKAWKDKSGMNKDDAMQSYINLVDKMLAKYTS